MDPCGSGTWSRSWPNIVLHWPSCRWVSQNLDFKAECGQDLRDATAPVPARATLFPHLDHSLSFSSFFFISPFHSWLFSSDSAFQWENRGDAAGSFAGSQPHVPRCWPRAGRQLPAATAERWAQNPPLNHIIQLICIAICCHKFSAHLIYWLYQEYHERNNCTKTIEYQSVNQKQEFSLQLETKQCYNLPCKGGSRIQKQGKKGTILFLKQGNISVGKYKMLSILKCLFCQVFLCKKLWLVLSLLSLLVVLVKMSQCPLPNSKLRVVNAWV